MTGERLPRSATILLVEDEVPIRQLCHEGLAEAGFTLLTAPDGPAALRLSEAARLQPLDLLLTDVFLPGELNGVHVAQQLVDHQPDLKVLYMSGFSAADLIGQGLLAPDWPFLSKPFTVSDLLAKINQVLSGPTFA
jgi:DNA-binding response OmpR family regulator